MSQTAHLHLFEGYGIEMEYMIVDRATLKVRPVADRTLAKAAGISQGFVNEVERGAMAWSNELVMHVLEIKTNGPAPTLVGLDALFQAEVNAIDEILAPLGARLMPTAMHPFFDPETETKLWTHDDNEVYAAYDRIFGCKGHGWSNLQSIHINLPFYDDQEFGRLHAAIRLVLPLLPALAASSPIYEGKVSGSLDSRLEFYQKNQRAVPSLTGPVVPERAFSKATYDEVIYAKIRRDIGPHDPAGILEEVWLNSRGAIARFDRNAIEIRLLDIQESPRMDAAVIATVVSVVQALVDERWTPLAAQQQWPEAPLAELFRAAVKQGGATPVADQAYLAALGIKSKTGLTAQEVWRRLAAELLATGRYPVSAYAKEVTALVRAGTLASRILKALGPSPSPAAVRGVYERLCGVLAAGGAFDAEV